MPSIVLGNIVKSTGLELTLISHCYVESCKEWSLISYLPVGKTEEVVLKKLEYIYAKQQALETQKRKKKMGSDEFDVSPRINNQQEGSSTSVELGQMFINNKRGKPLILSRKRDQATGRRDILCFSWYRQTSV